MILSTPFSMSAATSDFHFMKYNFIFWGLWERKRDQTFLLFQHFKINCET